MLFLILFAFMGNANATTYHFAPQNDRKIPVKTMKRGGLMTAADGLDEATFTQALADVTKTFQPVFKAHGWKLKIKNLWTDATVNSDTSQSGNSATVNAYGGLARYPNMTYDAYVQVLCHEVGHHLGFFPFYSDSAWAASTEGEADNFSSLKGMRYMFADADNQSAVAKMTIPPTVKTRCSQTWGTSNDIALCERSAMSSFTLASVLHDLAGSSEPNPISFDTPDQSVVTATNEDHPASQCRLDQYFQSALCPVDYKIDLSSTDPTVGDCSTEGGYNYGTRQLCWYKPQSTFTMMARIGNAIDWVKTKMHVGTKKVFK